MVRYLITGKRKYDGKMIKVYRTSKTSANVHANAAKKYGASNIRIKKVK